jgi:hypothetical protein
MINEPPPEMSVMEDGNNTSGKKKKSNSNPAEEFGKTFSESMDKVGLLLSTVIGANTGTAHGEQQIETYQAGPSEHMDDMNKALELIRKLDPKPKPCAIARAMVILMRGLTRGSRLLKRHSNVRGNILTILEKRKERTRPNSGLVEVLLENIFRFAKWGARVRLYFF